jgi:hypothetical protein
MKSKYVYSIIGTFVILLFGAGSTTLNNENIYAQQGSESEPNPKLNATPPMSLNLTDEDVEVSDRPLNNISTLEGMEKSQIGDIVPGEQNTKFEGQQLQQQNQTNK